MIDIIIISEAKDYSLREVTRAAISSAIMASEGVHVRIIVVERGDATYDDAITLRYNDKFNYNRMANYAIMRASASSIIVANNDVEFTNDSIKTLYESKPLVVSPVDPKNDLQKNINGIEFGTTTSKHFSGWCFLMRRPVWEHIGSFNEEFPFWYCDDMIIDQLKMIGVTPAVCGDAIVHHKVSTTLNRLSFKERANLTTNERKRFQSFIENRNKNRYTHSSPCLNLDMH